MSQQAQFETFSLLTPW